ncbi:lysophospholipid acyltransferase family protein [Orrella marina]|uniref:Acyltransferase n=1 Tax=Orrella marina TaxID=2163011 RepID=A0A2R4XL84_9BURK|nr:lysophospholipid acyltransferase family protein [Orrella marina]AWB34566.1 acyltransferase [Orrella marina]
MASTDGHDGPGDARAWRVALRQLKRRSIKAWLVTTLFQVLARVGHRPRQWLGAFLGILAPILIRHRAQVVERNLELCFPARSAAERKRMLRAHFRAMSQTVVDRSVLWFGSPDSIRNLVRLEGLEHIRDAQAKNRNIMLLAPHFVGLDASASRLTLEGPEGATIYAPQSDPDIDALVRLGRGRFHQVHLISRREGIRGLVRKIRAGIPIYYLPDMDLGRRGAIFAPFFGIEAATQTATAQLARQFGMVVFPVLSFRDPGSGQYLTKVLAPLADFPEPNGTPESDTIALNRHLQDWIEQAPEQYYWVHRRFKSRPPGQPGLYR